MKDRKGRKREEGRKKEERKGRFKELNGGGRGEWVYVYVWLSPWAVHLELSQCC